MIQPGYCDKLGAIPDAEGSNFSVFSSLASAVELCLFDEAGQQSASFELPDCSEGIWHGYVPGCKVGQRYGYRVHGPYSPSEGQRCNPAKLLIDPYARALDGHFRWHDALYDYDRGSDQDGHRINTIDSAAYMPKSLVCDEAPVCPPLRPAIPWANTVFYEANVRGFTMRHPAVSDSAKGRFAGMQNAAIVDYLKALGITSIELMPVHAFIDEQHLVDNGLRNYWGYNPVAFFAPSPRYSQGNPVAEFQEMVRHFHDAGIEVILDVVYNHTGEGGGRGPSFGFRGLDNLAYYRTEPSNPEIYVNDTGCGNTLNTNHPMVQRLVMDSLRYWHQDLGVDGFRFDLAPALGRHRSGFSASHAMLNSISCDPQLANAKLIAEPWDPGPGGYQLGRFPQRWGEWNDRFRDTARDFWRGNTDSMSELAKRLHGSADIFESSDRAPFSSVNFVSSHDGFTLADVASFEQRHNQANGENNRDGHRHNYSCNFGIEGPTADQTVIAKRRRHRLNLLATLLFSQGTPMILAGDEFGQTQNGNNNAYAQDNDTAWLDWSKLQNDPDFSAQVRKLIRLRRDIPLLRLDEYLHGNQQTEDATVSISWLAPNGQQMSDHDWWSGGAFCKVLSEVSTKRPAFVAAIVINGSACDQEFDLRPAGLENLCLEFSSAVETSVVRQRMRAPSMTISLLATRPAM